MTLNAELSAICGRLVRSVEALPIYFDTSDIRRNHGSSTWLFPWAAANSGVAVFRGETGIPGKRGSGKTSGTARGKSEDSYHGWLADFRYGFPFHCSLGGTERIVVAAMAAYLLLTVVGFADDYLKISKKNSKGLPGRFKLLGQLLTTVVVLLILLGPLGDMLTGVQGKAIGSSSKMLDLWVPFYKDVVLQGMSLILVFILFMLTLCGSSNAINLTDGLDGLAIGCTVTVALTYGIMAYASGNYLISDYLRISFVPGTGELAAVRPNSEV